ncbi:LacI family DNA-binding transcriptional regulator [Streptomyces sp. SID8379]|nr:LacI family DNA-binding transcriptional regulator [Streptomyces sp. SID8379]MYW64362.1 LacI family DNA-binding transcriptional regulator [Streptomyces sp. SID8379]
MLTAATDSRPRSGARHPAPSWLTPLAGGGVRLRGAESLSSRHRQSLVARRQQHTGFTFDAEVAFDPASPRQTAGLVHLYTTGLWHYAHLTHDEEPGRVLRLATRDRGRHVEPAAAVAVPGDRPQRRTVVFPRRQRCWPTTARGGDDGSGGREQAAHDPTISGEVTIGTIAAEAGVPTATVSKVLNGRVDVSTATRDRIRAIMARPPPPAPAGTTSGRSRRPRPHRARQPVVDRDHPWRGAGLARRGRRHDALRRARQHRRHQRPARPARGPPLGRRHPRRLRPRPTATYEAGRARHPVRARRPGRQRRPGGTDESTART